MYYYPMFFWRKKIHRSLVRENLKALEYYRIQDGANGNHDASVAVVKIVKLRIYL